MIFLKGNIPGEDGLSKAWAIADVNIPVAHLSEVPLEWKARSRWKMPFLPNVCSPVLEFRSGQKLGPIHRIKQYDLIEQISRSQPPFSSSHTK